MISQKNNEYWNNFYKNNNTLIDSSSFAKFCLEKYIKNKATIVELGSGNGRDAIYFANHKHTVYALDLSIEAVKTEQKFANDKMIENLTILHDDFINFDYSTLPNIDIFYSRFTMHSIDEDAEDIILNKIYNSLEIDGLCMIEARTIHDSLINKGKRINANISMTNHYRRFINSDIFLKKCLAIGFRILYFTEESGLSVYKDDDPVLLRLIMTKCDYE